MSMSNYTPLTDVLSKVYSRTTHRLNTVKTITVDYSENSYSDYEEATLGLMNSYLYTSTDLLGYRTKNFVIVNDGPDALGTIKIQAGPNGDDWEDIDITTFSGLASGSTKGVDIVDSRKYWRIIGNSTGTSSVITYVNGLLV